VFVVVVLDPCSICGTEYDSQSDANDCASSDLTCTKCDVKYGTLSEKNACEAAHTKELREATSKQAAEHNANVDSNDAYYRWFQGGCQ
jgi:ribosome-binding protein aMBF1 (putative translation factor)